MSDTVKASGSKIEVWRFRDAPQLLQELSENGGDEDWLAVLPHTMGCPSWMESGSFGYCCVDRYPHPNRKGLDVVIGSHS
jgi:hypothetical protein